MNSRAQHHLKTFTSASAFPHALLPSTPSLNDVTCRETNDLDKPRLLHVADEQMELIKQLKISSQFKKHLPQNLRSHMRKYRAHCRQIRLQVRKLMNLINLNFCVKLMKTQISFYNPRIRHIWKHLPKHPRSHMQHYQARRHQMRFKIGKLMKLINLHFFVKLIKTGFYLTTHESSTIWKQFSQHPHSQMQHF